MEDTSDSTFVVILKNVFSKDLILDREHRLVQVGVNLESVELFCLVVLAALPSSSGWERGKRKEGELPSCQHLALYSSI